MRPGLRHAAADAAGGFPRAGLAVVFCAASFLLRSTAGEETVPAGSEWQLLLAFVLLAAGSLCLMRGMRLLDARRATAIAVRWSAGDPDPELAVVVAAASFLLHSTAGGEMVPAGSEWQLLLAFALLAAGLLCLMHGMRLGDARRAPAIAVRWNAGDPDPDLAVVVTAASFLLHSTAGGETVPAGSEWQLLLAFALLAACSLCLMHGMRLGDARRAPAIAVRWNAWDPDPDLAVVVTAASFLLHSTAGGETVPARSEWQLLLAFALLAAGLLCLMHGMRLGDARRAPAIAVRWNAGDPNPDLAVVVTAASFLLHSTAGGETVPAGSEWQLLLAFALLAAGSLCLMHGMRLHGARRAPAIAVRWNAGDPDPERLLP